MTIEQQEAAAIAWMEARRGKFAYSNSRPAKLDPDSSGKSDCSGVIFADYTDLGYEMADNDMSYELAAGGRHIASGNTLAQFRAIAHLLRPGDVIGMARRSGYGAGTAINHVEMSTGPGTASWGHGGYPSMGPNLNSLAVSYLLPDAAWWTVRRYITTKPTPTETPTIEQEEEPMFIIKSPNRPHALVAPGTFHKFRTSEELTVTSKVLSPTIKDAISDRQYDVIRAVIVAGTLDATSTAAQLKEIYAALDAQEQEG